MWAALLVGCLLPWLAPALRSAAAGCPTMTVEQNLTRLQLSPAVENVDAGGCVAFANATVVTVQVRVAPGYSVTLARGGSTSGTGNYRASSAGTHGVVASDPSGALTAANGRIIVAAAPARSPSARPSASASAARSSQPRPSPTPGGQTSTGPVVATPSLSLPPSAGSSPASPAAATPLLPTPTVSPSPGPTSSAAVVAGPVEPPSGRGAGLPAALAALAIVGTAGALLRVLLAERLPRSAT